jgi:hypothetical protein
MSLAADQARRPNAAAPYWITLNETDEQKLRDWVPSPGVISWPATPTP